MNLSRLRSLEDGLTGQSRKVYEVLETGYGHTVKSVMDRLAERGMRPERAVVERCLHEQVDRGLVKESDGTFRRVQAEKPKIAAVPTSSPPSEPTPTAAPVVPEKPLTSLDELAAIDERLAAIFANLNAAARELQTVRESIAAAAVRIEENAQRVRNDYAKLESLKTLLRGLSET